MIRIFQSGWFAALTGCVLYLAITIMVLSPSKFAGAQFIKPDYSADDDPSWRFRNPEFNEWVSQIQNEKERLDLREQQLDEWQLRLNTELQEISTVTQTVNQLQSSFDKDVVRFKAQDMDNVKHQAKLIAAMSPEGAIAMLNQMSDDDVVRILYTMKPEEASVILDTLSKISQDEAKRAALLTERIHEVLPETAARARNSLMHTLPHILTTTGADPVSPSEIGPVLSPKTGGMAGVFEEMMNRALSAPLTENQVQNGKNGPQQSPAQKVEVRNSYEEQPEYFDSPKNLQGSLTGGTIKGKNPSAPLNNVQANSQSSVKSVPTTNSGILSAIMADPSLENDAIPDLSDEKNEMEEAFQNSITSGVSFTSKESLGMNGKSQQPQIRVQSVVVPQAYPNTIESVNTVNVGKKAAVPSNNVQGSTQISNKSTEKAGGNPGPEKNSPVQVEAPIVNLQPNPENINQIPLAAISMANPGQQNISEKPFPVLASQTGIKTKPNRAVQLQAKQASTITAKVSTADLSESQATPKTRAMPLLSTASLTTKDPELQAKDLETSVSFDSIEADSSKTKPAPELEDQAFHKFDSVAGSVAQAQPDSNGTSIAKQDMSMKQAEKTNEIAGQREQVLPGSGISITRGNPPSVFSTHSQDLTATTPVNSSTVGSSDPSATVPVSSTGGLAAPGAGARTLERTQDMVTLNAVRLSDSGNSSMQVVIKPDAGTQLSLELRQHGGNVEVQAVLQQGDFNHLAQQWPDLQQRLDQRGIKLASLTDEAALNQSNGGETFQHKQGPSQEPTAEATFSEVPNEMLVPRMANEPARRNWETWA